MDSVKVQKVIEQIKRLTAEEKIYFVEKLVRDDDHLAESLARDIEIQFEDRFYDPNLQ